MHSMTTIPAPRTLEPAPTLRWGLLGPGWIPLSGSQTRWAGTARSRSSRSDPGPQRAQAFAAQHGIARAVGSAQELVRLDEVEIVYIGALTRAIVRSPNWRLEPATCADREASRHDPRDALAITELGRERGLLVMEAMWTRYLPQADVLRQLLDDRAIGEVTFISAEFGGVTVYDPGNRLFNPALGGGVLVDAGVYPVSFIVSVLGVPTSVLAAGTLAPSGVDDHVQLTLSYDGGPLPLPPRHFARRSPCVRWSRGPGAGSRWAPFIVPSTLSLSTRTTWEPDPDAKRWTDDALAEPRDALHYQADAAARYVREGRVESPLHDHDQTIGVIAVLEEARRQLGGR